MNFAQPLWLVALILLPFAVWGYRTLMATRVKAAVKFSNLKLIKRTMPSEKITKRNNVIFTLTLLTLACMIIALADPHIPLEQTKEGVNIVLVLDVSGSMAAQDYKPNRLEAAKNSAQTLIKNLGFKDNVGIVVFSDGATTSSYLTPYKEKAVEKLKSVTLGNGRTAIGDGLSLAIDMATSIPNKKRVVVLLSDGENNAGVISPGEAVEFAKINNIQVYTVGVGSEQPVVLGYDWFGNPQYAKLDEDTLKAIAAETDGRYYKAIDQNTLDEIYERIPEDIKREKEETSIKNWFILASILFLSLGFYLRYGRYGVIQ